MAPWNQAPNPVNTANWRGDCSSLDTVISTPPEFVEFAELDDVLFLEGFEMDEDYVDGTSANMFTRVSINGTPFALQSLAADSRLSKTGGISLKCTANSTTSGILQFPHKVIDRTMQYFRAYFKLLSFTNTNGSERSAHIFGWTDSTGHRSTVYLSFPATSGASLKFGVAQNTLSGAQNGTATIALDTWYRCELTTEVLSGVGGQNSSVTIFLGDTDTVVDTISLTNAGGSFGGFPAMIAGTPNTGNEAIYLLDDVRVQTITQTLPVTPNHSPLYGAGGVWPMYAFSDDATLSEWTPLSGTDHFAMVDEFPTVFDDATSYVSSAGTAELTDLYNIRAYENFSTVPTNTNIKAVNVRARARLVSGSSPTIKAVYVDPPSSTNWLGKASQTTGSYANYPATSSLPNLFLIYNTGLNIGFKNQQKIGIQRVSGGSSDTVRATSVWGYMDIQ